MSDGSPTRRQALVWIGTALAAGAVGYGVFTAVGPAPEDEREEREDAREEREDARDDARDDAQDDAQDAGDDAEDAGDDARDREDG
ncbi:hypothetical protein [Puerhibacterium sp. TATVAM-FAB25]|uniref:hypothetical protein n=1 Tax=Puerhibacterium sp. TATVAM-FAB25 TaxID=3093699 RepID=UPI00397852E1